MLSNARIRNLFVLLTITQNRAPSAPRQLPPGCGGVPVSHRRLIQLGLKAKSEMKDWKWTQDPKTLLWIIGALVFLIWVFLQRQYY